MKYDQKKGGRTWTGWVSAVCILCLAACGKAGDSSSPSGNSDSGSRVSLETGPATGRLLGTVAISGIAYSASSGAIGITDNTGLFKYNHGDTVEFKLGNLVLGKIKGAAIITPIELAQGNSARLQNTLVLLQSIDEDGNPGNGISIPAGAVSGVTAAVSLDSDPATFISSAGLQKIKEASGVVAGAVRTIEQVNTSFLSHTAALLGTHIWVKYDDTTASMIRISENGTDGYLQGEATPDDSCDANRVCGGDLVIKAGVEYGTASIGEFDTRGFRFNGTPAIDTNLRAGLSHPRPTWRIRTDGVDLIATDIVTVQRERKQASVFGELFHIAGTLEISSDKEPIKTEVKESRFSKMDNDPKGIIGAWAADPAIIKTQIYLFFPNGRFLLVDPVSTAGDEANPGCASPGIEFSSYTYDTGNGSLGIKSITYNTNGCAGFSDNPAVSFKIAADGKTATVETQNKTILNLYRVSR